MKARTPSVKTLAPLFDNPHEAKRILQMSRAELIAHPVGARRMRECFNPPQTYDLRMTILASLPGSTFGYESAEVNDEYLDYLNAGDFYASTLVRWRGHYRVTCPADIIERFDRSNP
jgi:hypothetical protein